MQIMFAALIVISMLLTGCGIKGNPDPLALSDLIFDEEDFVDNCTLASSDVGSINPIISSDRQYIEDFVARSFNDENLTTFVDTVLSSAYLSNEESGQIGIFGIKFSSDSKADEAADFLKNKHTDESMNLVYNHKKLVIWIWQENSSTEDCFENLKGLVEYELKKHDFPIPKYF